MNDKLNTELFATVNSNSLHSYHKNKQAQIQRKKQIQQRADRELGLYTLFLTASLLITGFAM
ncbi:MAG: hypothetical protein J6E46_07275 [Faecalicoccus sp.]|nr:hypothetical protein [Faecalicoccus sp.]